MAETEETPREATELEKCEQHITFVKSRAGRQNFTDRNSIFEPIIFLLEQERGRILAKQDKKTNR
jgi:hypothetical protein